MDHGGDAIVSMVFSLTIIPRVRVGYELAIIISYPTRASGIIVLSKTPTKYREFFLALFVTGLEKKFFWPFGPQFGLKMRRGADPRAPPLDHHWIVTNVLTLAHPM